MIDKEQSKKAKAFAEFWKDKGYEKGQSQSFWLQLISEVYGIERPTEFIEFEDQVHIDKNTGFIDAYIPSTKVLIEQKSIDKDLRIALLNLFKVLDTKIEDRDPYMKEELAQFPYVNGGLFADESIEIPMLNEKVKELFKVFRPSMWFTVIF